MFLWWFFDWYLNATNLPAAHVIVFPTNVSASSPRVAEYLLKHSAATRPTSRHETHHISKFGSVGMPLMPESFSSPSCGSKKLSSKFTGRKIVYFNPEALSSLEWSKVRATCEGCQYFLPLQFKLCRASRGSRQGRGKRNSFSHKIRAAIAVFCTITRWTPPRMSPSTAQTTYIDLPKIWPAWWPPFYLLLVFCS